MSFLKFLSHDQQVVNEYFRLRRQQRFERYGPRAKAIGFHNAMHYILIFALKALRLFEKRKVVVLADRRRARGKRPTVYACTHMGDKDIESIFEAIHNPCYLFLGDPGPVYRSIDGLMLWLNGVISLETRSKPDRAIAKERALSLLKQGGSLMIFPEGAWNISENLPAMKLFTGAAAIALENKADIVPVSVEKYDDTYYVMIGEALHHSDFAHYNQKGLTAELRDILATLKWEIWENFGIFPREGQFSEDFKKKIFSLFDSFPGYTIQDAVETRYYDKNITEPNEAFAHLDQLIPRRENAFLLRKR